MTLGFNPAIDGRIMKNRSLALVIGMVLGLVGVAWTNSGPASSLSLVSKPVFNQSAPLGIGIAGKKYTHNFCEPVTARACGGPFAKNQVNPSGGNGGPYIFKIKIGSGFAPTGLALSPRTGILTGIIAKSAAKKGVDTPYPFTVCVSDRSGETCNKFKIIVQSAIPKPETTSENNLPLEGYWRGGIVWQTPSGCYNTESNFGIADWGAKYLPGPKLYDFTMAGYGIKVPGPNKGETLVDGETYSWNYPVGEKTYKVEGKLNGSAFNGTVYLNYQSSCRNSSGESIKYTELRGVLSGKIISF